jgi:hypothetical protein
MTLEKTMLIIFIALAMIGAMAANTSNNDKHPGKEIKTYLDAQLKNIRLDKPIDKPTPWE